MAWGGGGGGTDRLGLGFLEAWGNVLQIGMAMFIIHIH